MRTYYNADDQERTWLWLRDPRTDSTLCLQAKEEVDLDLPEDFSDHWLLPVASKQTAPEAIRRQKAITPVSTEEVPADH